VSDNTSTVSNLNVFISHGSDPVERDRIVAFIKSRSKRFGIVHIDFSSVSAVGDIIPNTILSLPEIAHAAIILVTPDDIGGKSGGPSLELRARENVWMELGLFLGRLGPKRTLVLSKGDVSIISNIKGVLVAAYTTSLSKVAKIDKFLASIREKHSKDVSEFVYFSNDPETRYADWAAIHAEAKKDLVITGIAMSRVVDALPTIANYLEEKPDLVVRFAIVHPNYIQANNSFFETHHGKGTRKDNLAFFQKMSTFLAAHRKYAKRIRVFGFRSFPVFSAVVADGGSFGSPMLYQTTLPRTRERGFDAPRIRLRKIVKGGLYDTYWHGVLAMIEGATEIRIKVSKQ